MQRYRINYHWLIGVFISSIIFAIAAFFVWSWQINRKAGHFLASAEAALAEGKPREALESYYSYVQLRPDEDEARIELGKAAVEVIKSGDATSEELGQALGILDQTVRITDDPASRRELGQILMMFRRHGDAADHFEALLDASPNDSELKGLHARALFRDKRFDQFVKHAYEIIGYDRETDTFDSEAPSLDGESDVYDLLAKVLMQQDENSDLARRVIDQMIVANPEDPMARLRKSYYLSGIDEYKEATQFLDEAYALDPKDAAILLAKASEALGSNYPGTKDLYLAAMASYEAALAGLLPRNSTAIEDANYEVVKQNYLDAVSRFERSSSDFEVATSEYEASKSEYEATLSKLAELKAIVQAASNDEKFKQIRADFSQAKANFEEAMSDPKAARIYIAVGLEEHPDVVRFYQLMAAAEQRLEQNERALEIVEEGIEKLGKIQSIDLVLYKIDLLFSKVVDPDVEQDFSDVEREIERLVQAKRQDIVPIIDLQRARILYKKRSWAAAAKELRRIRPLLYEASRSRFQAMAGAMLGISYESQGINDLAMQAYQTVLNDNPDHELAKAGKLRIAGKNQPRVNNDGVELDQIINRTLELPEAEQDWRKIDELVVELIKENELSVARQKLLRAKVLIKRGRFEQAKKLIREAAKDAPDDINIHYAAILLVASDPEQGTKDALHLLDRLERKWGRSLQSRAQRADLLVILRAENVSDQLRALLNDTDDLTADELLRLYRVLGLKFEQLGQVADAREFYEKSAAMEPNNLPIRMHLFDLALRARDDGAMRKAQEAILEFVKSKSDASYLLTEVKRQIMSFDRREIDQAELAAARKMLDAALVQRPKWHELHIAYGQLLLLLGGDKNEALKWFDDALAHGPPKNNAVGVQIKLLAGQGLFGEARERMNRIRKESRGRVLGELEAEILLKNNEPAEAFVAAKKFAERQPNNPAVQSWFSKISQRVGKLDVAIAALRRALERSPSAPEEWLRLIGLHVEQKSTKEIEGVLREAHLASEADALPMLTAKKHELSSQWQMAEDIYLANFAGRLDDLSVLRRIADFYLFWSKKDQANVGKAAIYINRILRAANEGRVSEKHPHVVWARQKAAKILFSRNDYQQSLKAERLLRQSTVSRQMTRQESELLIDILISRNDPNSLKQAIALLTQLRKQNRIPQKGALQLASILNQTDQWEAARSLMVDLISKYPKDRNVRKTYISLLIDQGDYPAAENALKRLKDMGPMDASVVRLRARLASERGDQVQLMQLLNALVPSNRTGALSAAELQTMLGVAQMATRFGANEFAKDLYETYVKRLPDEAFELAKFLAYHGDCDRAIQLMKRMYDDRTDDVVQLANSMIKARRGEIGDKFDDAVNRLIDKALRDDPDSIMRQLARAEALDTQAKHEESIEAYEELLSRDDLPTRMRAAAKNNLGFQLGLLNQRVDEAEELINEAMETFGPVEDMLDTRAVVRIAQGKYDLAIEDMELALSVSRDPVKYFHLAKAYILAGDGQAANRAWERAVELGFDKETLPKLEKTDFDEILQKIKSWQRNAKL